VVKRIIITGGGTGGHVFPGIAVARELTKQPEVEVLYVGKNQGPEAGWVAQAGFAFEGIRVSGFPRGLTLKYFTFLADFARGFLVSNLILSRFKPAAVFSTGGYVSVPLSLAAALRGVPVALFEPNVLPGLAAKVLALFSRRIFTGFEATLRAFSQKKARWSGIPVRQEILTAEKTQARRSFGLDAHKSTILMLGGSQGARNLNRFLADLITFLGQGAQDIQAILMTGPGDFKKTVDRLDKCALKRVIRPFIANIHEAYAAADLVVARSGAMTCGEITARGLPAVLVPYPHAKGHQEANARALEKAGSALVILEKELSDENLSQTVLALLKDTQRLKGMGESAKALAKSDAAGEIARGLLEMAEGK
jgi:UDP-N-acetylglucosamine--N-acetylmuramyl-(pentapeptide) pyrophosphoryl-undecaprenol N-acetylglucosamine transferase